MTISIKKLPSFFNKAHKCMLCAIYFAKPTMIYGFRKGYSTQHELMRFIEKCRELLDKNGHAGALLMDLSKAFDCLEQDSLIAKLHTYGFSKVYLR